ncbi:hypothetical protein ST44_02315 [Prevotella pectinovora]|uniref:Uncharacterized protein n=1 Tax=Prevotella pectinovora TaxID=1602169 RepID=A0A0D0HEX3_9BACT|nr:hypothetical protein ST44_02315 [Prevotella pectinovora]
MFQKWRADIAMPFLMWMNVERCQSFVFLIFVIFCGAKIMLLIKPKMVIRTFYWVFHNCLQSFEFYKAYFACF